MFGLGLRKAGVSKGLDLAKLSCPACKVGLAVSNRAFTCSQFRVVCAKPGRAAQITARTGRGSRARGSAKQPLTPEFFLRYDGFDEAEYLLSMRLWLPTNSTRQIETLRQIHKFVLARGL